MKEVKAIPKAPPIPTFWLVLGQHRAGALGADVGPVTALGEARSLSCDSRMRFHMLWWVIPPSPLHHHVAHGPESSSTLSLTPSPLVCEEDSSFRQWQQFHRQTPPNRLPLVTHLPVPRPPHHPLSSHDGPPHHTTPHHTTPRPRSQSLKACLSLSLPLLYVCFACSFPACRFSVFLHNFSPVSVYSLHFYLAVFQDRADVRWRLPADSIFQNICQSFFLSVLEHFPWYFMAMSKHRRTQCVCFPVCILIVNWGSLGRCIMTTQVNSGREKHLDTM